VRRCSRWCWISQFCYILVVGQWRVLWLPEAERELTQLPVQERAAMMNAVLQLEAVAADVPAFQ
jgi:hypothetical protein